MINRLCIVLAHGAVKEIVLRHLPIWAKNHERTIICSPADDPLTLPGEWCFVNGKSSLYAAETNERARQAMLFASEVLPRFLTVCEYDALLWRWPMFLDQYAGIDFANLVAGSLFLSADPKFQGKTYIHTPIIFGHQAIQRVVKAMFELPIDAEFGFGDRYFGLAVEHAGLTVMDGHKYGASYSQNHITSDNWADATSAISGGACFTHGIKDAQSLDVCMKAAKISY